MSHFEPLKLYDRHGNRKYLNTQERKAFYQETQKITDDQKLLFLLILFWTGVRISEALNLMSHNIDFDDKVVIVKSLKKRGRTIHRRIPIPPQLLLRLENFIKNRNNEVPLFPWSRRTGSRYVKKTMISAGLQGSKACSKGLRHSFAVHCVTCNIPLSLLQKWMGHSSMATTAIYLNIMGSEERELAKRIWSDDKN